MFEIKIIRLRTNCVSCVVSTTKSLLCLVFKFFARTRTIFGHWIRYFYPQASELVILFFIFSTGSSSDFIYSASRRIITRRRIHHHNSFLLFSFTFSIFQPKINTFSLVINLTASRSSYIRKSTQWKKLSAKIRLYEFNIFKHDSARFKGNNRTCISHQLYFRPQVKKYFQIRRKV